MKTLTVRQPWAWAIIHAGKNFENRTWATAHRGPLLIHAAKSRPHSADIAACAEACATTGVTMPAEFALGVAVGTVDVIGMVDVTPDTPSPWWYGPVGWQLRNPRPVAPFPIHGQLGVFDAKLPSGF